MAALRSIDLLFSRLPKSKGWSPFPRKIVGGSLLPSPIIWSISVSVSLNIETSTERSAKIQIFRFSSCARQGGKRIFLWGWEGVGVVPSDRSFWVFHPSLVPESLFERHNAAAEIDGPDRRMYDDVMPIINQSNGLVCLIRLAPDFIQGEGLMNLGLQNICLSLHLPTADRGRCGGENRNPKDV